MASTRLAARRPGSGGLRPLRYVTLGCLLALVAVPLLSLFWRGLRPEPLSGIFSAEVYEATANSLLTSGLGALLGTAFGCALAWVLERTDIPARNFFRAAFFLPFLVPPFIGAIGWLAVFGPVGYGNEIYNHLTGSEDGLVDIFGPGGIVVLLALYGYPIAYLLVAAAFQGVPVSLEEAARASGAGRLRVAADVTLPFVLPAAIAGFILIFVTNLSDFGVPALLGLPVQYEVLPTLIYGYLVSGTAENPIGAASALGSVLLVFAMAAFFLQRNLSRRVETDSGGSTSRPVALGAARRPLTVLLFVLAFLFTIAPALALLAGALLRAPGVPFTLENLTLANLARALSAPNTVDGFLNSLFLSTGAAVICGLLGACVALLVVRSRSRLNGILDNLALAPQALPGTVVAVAWILAGIPLGIYNTSAILLFAYVTAFMAFVVQAARGALTNVPAVLEDAARLSGASAPRAMRDITLPLVSPAVAVGMGLVFFTVIRELTISALLISPGSETLGVVVFNLQQAGDFTAATSLGLIVMVASLAAVGALTLLVGGKEGLWRGSS